MMPAEHEDETRPSTGTPERSSGSHDTDITGTPAPLGVPVVISDEALKADIERSRARGGRVGVETEPRPKLDRGTIAKRQKRVKEKAGMLPKGPI